MAHNLTLTDKRELMITGVKEVVDFDEREITVIIGEDRLCVKGGGLKIGAFDEKSGELRCVGEVYSLVYGKNIPTLKRLFK